MAFSVSLRRKWAKVINVVRDALKKDKARSGLRVQNQKGFCGRGLAILDEPSGRLGALGGLEEREPERSRETGSKQSDQKAGANGMRRRNEWGWTALEEARTEEWMTALWDCTGVP